MPEIRIIQHGVDKVPDDVLEAAKKIGLSMGLEEVHVGSPEEAEKFIQAAKDGGQMPEENLFIRVDQNEMEDLPEGAKDIPYNGVKGDSCDCPRCNLRRKESGPMPGLDEETARFNSLGNDESPLKKLLFEALQGNVNKGVDPQELRDKLERVVEEEVGDFSKMSPEDKAQAMRNKYEQVREKLQERAKQVQACLEDMVKIVDQLVELEGKENPASRILMLIMLKRLEQGLNFLGLPKKD